jgi:hypothetical protein
MTLSKQQQTTLFLVVGGAAGPPRYTDRHGVTVLHETARYGRESRETGNQQWLCWREQVEICPTDRETARLSHKRPFMLSK